MKETTNSRQSPKQQNHNPNNSGNRQLKQKYINHQEEVNDEDDINMMHLESDNDQNPSA